MLPYAFVILNWSDKREEDNEWTEVIPVMPGDYIDDHLDAVRVAACPNGAFEVTATIMWVKGAEVNHLGYLDR